jgi:hypothetical protein
MTANTWAEVPGNTLASIDPEDNPAINPSYPSNAPWHGNGGLGAAIGAWNSAAFDPDTDTVHIVCAGGHADYAGNEAYRVALGDESCDWELYRNPTGAIGNTGTLNDGQDATGVYFDGAPRSTHTYGYLVHARGVGVVIARITSPYPGGQNDVKKAFKLTSAGTYSLLKDYSAESGIGNSPAGATAYDPTRHCLWVLSTGTAQLYKIDLATGNLTKHGTFDNHAGAYNILVYVPGSDVLLHITDGSPTLSNAKFTAWNLSTFAHTAVSFTGSFASGYTLNGQTGAAWTGTRLLLWDQTTNRAQISALTPTGNLISAAWTASALTVSGSNIVTPSAAPTNGVYGRFGYSSRLNGVFLVNSISEPIYFYALS